jgi:hypothetical protein
VQEQTNQEGLLQAIVEGSYVPRPRDAQPEGAAQ